MKKTPKTIALMLTLSLIASSGCNIVRETETSARGSSETETTTTEEPTTTTESEETGSSKESESEASSSATESAPEETKETGIKGIKDGSIIETLEDPGYIIIKSENGEWIELAKGTVYYLTKAGNKVYYADKYTLKCVDITDPELKENTLFKFYKWHNDEYDCEEILNISHAVVVGNTMYFGYSSFAAGTEDTDGVLKIDLDAGSLDEAEQLIPVADFGWKISEKAIFYCDGSERSSYQTLYRYDLATGDKTQVMKGVRSFDIQDGKILILSDDGLKLMDLKSGDIQTVTENDGWTRSGNLWGYAELHNGDVYYLAGNNVVKYDNGNNTPVLKIDSPKFLYFDFIYNDVIEIISEESPNEYFAYGEKITDLKDITDITVKMKNGKSKDLSMTDFYVSE
ncbi:MAG: hypothetical protein J5778_07375 [Clostridiales bacterium]|nr:hypothetical protein [Clostridiales bacterium]